MNVFREFQTFKGATIAFTLELCRHRGDSMRTLSDKGRMTRLALSSSATIRYAGLFFLRGSRPMVDAENNGEFANACCIAEP